MTGSLASGAHKGRDVGTSHRGGETRSAGGRIAADARPWERPSRTIPEFAMEGFRTRSAEHPIGGVGRRHRCPHRPPGDDVAARVAVVLDVVAIGIVNAPRSSPQGRTGRAHTRGSEFFDLLEVLDLLNAALDHGRALPPSTLQVRAPGLSMRHRAECRFGRSTCELKGFDVRERLAIHGMHRSCGVGDSIGVSGSGAGEEVSPLRTPPSMAPVPADVQPVAANRSTAATWRHDVRGSYPFMSLIPSRFVLGLEGEPLWPTIPREVVELLQGLRVPASDDPTAIRGT